MTDMTAADRAAVLREAADRIEAMTNAAYERALSDDEIGYGNGLENAMRELRRMADETPPADTRPRCPHCQLPHDLDADSGAVAACRSIRDSLAAAEGPAVAAQPGKEARS